MTVVADDINFNGYNKPYTCALWDCSLFQPPLKRDRISPITKATVKQGISYCTLQYPLHAKNSIYSNPIIKVKTATDDKIVRKIKRKKNGESPVRRSRFFGKEDIYFQLFSEALSSLMKRACSAPVFVESSFV